MVLIGVLSTLLALIGGVGLFGIAQSNQEIRKVYQDRTVPAGQLGEVKALLLRNRLAIAAAQVTPTAEVIADRTAQVEANIAEVSELWEAYMTSNLSPAEDALAMAFIEARKQFVQQGLIPTITALRVDNLIEAERLVIEKIRPLFVPVEKGIDALVKHQLDEARRAYDDAIAHYARIRTLSIGVMVAGLLFGVVFGFVLIRSIARELGAEPGEAADLARHVAAGDLSRHIALKPGDSSSLMAQLKAMQEGLASVVGHVRENAESVATASAQIAQGNNDLSGRTEEQASALEQTSATMEQLNATVRQNADNARQASQLALGASSVAVRGGEVVAQVVDTMKGINDSSKKIADIIGVIDGIAFQTNILALNAAVEAARAGEQGRGFAVVAGEVRNLAQRSAGAAKEIKSLIIASGERVEQGTVLVGRAGETMQEIVDSIGRVNDIMGEISAASTEQSSGVAQVGEAITQMDQATQQNAALVEESAAAAESLRQQADQLVEAVSVFKLDPHSQRAAHDVRPDFKATVRQPSARAAQPAEIAPARTGTDDWASF
jgi:methyl-accepting chemotaxis protein-1 (serine sensor receptor)